MSSTFAFPSEDFPDLPAVELVVPAEWEAATVAGTHLAVLLKHEGEFSPNVTVTITRFSLEYSIESAIAALKNEFSLRDQGEWGSDSLATVGGIAGYRAEFVYVHPEAGTLLQSHYLLLAESGHTKFLVHATGSLAGRDVERNGVALRAVVESLRVRVR